MDKLIVNAIDYISQNGGERIGLVILPLGGLLLILKVIVDFKKNLSVIWVPKKPIKLADYDLDKHSKTAQEILEYNETLAFENTWGIHAERERREQLIVLKNRFGDRLNRRVIKSAYPFMKFEQGSINIHFRWYDHFYNFVSQLFFYFMLAICMLVILYLAFRQASDGSGVSYAVFLNAVGLIFILFVGIFLFAISNLGYSRAKIVKRLLEEEQESQNINSSTV